uniref:Uncharacterized protein n=1 Tax=Anopheles albimanus TaxID=7167 RepID=A0A182FZC9_ANOAL
MHRDQIADVLVQPLLCVTLGDQFRNLFRYVIGQRHRCTHITR